MSEMFKREVSIETINRTGYGQEVFEMRYDKSGPHTLDEDLIALFERHGWTWIETTIPKNPDFETTKIGTWIIKAKVKEAK